MLDAILMPTWEHRYYSFDSHWGENEQLASMRDGSGDHYFALFNAAGAILKGFAHESNMSPYGRDDNSVWPGILDSVPQVFSSFLNEPAVAIHETTFCIWRTYDDTDWQRGDVQYSDDEYADGSVDILSILDGRPESYQTWAEYYYGKPISIDAIRHVYEHRPLTASVVAALNPELSVDDLVEDIYQVDYLRAEDN